GANAYLNLYKIDIPKKIKRLYFYNPDMEPKLFARNLSRVNNFKFQDSNDLVWIEIPDIDFQITPKNVFQYKVEKEEIIKEEEDKKLFVKTLYKYIKKLFLDNDFYFKKGNNFISNSEVFSLDSNENVNAHLTYKIKIHNISNEYYLSILPKFTFLSKEPALESAIKSGYLYNIKSGKSFPYISGLDGILKIDIGNNQIVEVAYPENYLFNFTTRDAEKYGFSKEVHEIYKNKVFEGFKKIPKTLGFLNKITNLNENYQLKDGYKIFINVIYKFKNGESRYAKDVFKYSFYKNEQPLKAIFFFSSKKQFFEVQKSLKELFHNKHSVFYRAAAELGFSKVEFLRDSKTKSSAFLYNPEEFTVKNTEFINQIEDNVMAIVLLDKYIGNIDPLVRNFPDNLILQPILKEKLEDIKPFIIKSYVYKMGNFIPECKPFILKKMEDKEKNLYIGIDLSHDTYARKTNLCIAAVDNTGDILYIGKHKNLELNEKMNLDILEKEYIKAFEKYIEKFNVSPENVFILRAGRFIEDIEIIKNFISYNDTKYTLVEVNKNTNINSYDDLKEWIIKLDENTYIYYPKTFLNQKGVEVKILENNTDYTIEEIIEQIYLLTRVAHSTPYTNYKLPYPLHIANKVALTDYEWKLYIPY
uniref:Argonaute protein n=1 Tax=Marinitoga piezophila TaxID=149715 RepID=UPI000A1C7A14|nr:Chain A, Argonaute protein [Marinitoga piezophila]5UX0_D Chain D, Argonaute protein [Marinitoga piezophila]